MDGLVSGLTVVLSEEKPQNSLSKNDFSMNYQLVLPYFEEIENLI
jgi:hypothetical protein